MPRSFDFSGLQSRPPKGYAVTRADDELHLYHRRSEVTYKLRTHGENFRLMVNNPALSARDNFVMQYTDVAHALRYLGYGKEAGKPVTTQGRLFK